MTIYQINRVSKMKSTAVEKKNYKSLRQRKDTAFLCIGFFFLIAGSVAIVILKVMFFLNYSW